MELVSFLRFLFTKQLVPYLLNRSAVLNMAVQHCSKQIQHGDKPYAAIASENTGSYTSSVIDP